MQSSYKEDCTIFYGKDRFYSHKCKIILNNKCYILILFGEINAN